MTRDIFCNLQNLLFFVFNFFNRFTFFLEYNKKIYQICSDFFFIDYDIILISRNKSFILYLSFKLLLLIEDIFFYKVYNKKYMLILKNLTFSK